MKVIRQKEDGYMKVLYESDDPESIKDFLNGYGEGTAKRKEVSQQLTGWAEGYSLGLKHALRSEGYQNGFWAAVANWDKKDTGTMQVIE